MRFLVDAQLPPKLALWLRREGFTAEHLIETGLQHEDDAAIRRHALDHGAILITKDRDFSEAAGSTEKPLTVIWIRTGNATNAVLLTRVASAWPDVLKHLGEGAALVEVR